MNKELEKNKNENIIDISVICPTYCHEEYARKALDSILSQKGHFSMEILIADDASKDNTSEILKEYEEKYNNIKVIYREENVGATKNIQELLSIARGRYLAFLELDDYWTNNNKLQMQMELLDNNPDCSGCVHSYGISNQKGEIIEHSAELKDRCRCGFFTMRDFRRYGFIIHTSSFFCRNYYNGCVPDIISKSDRNRGDITLFYMFLQKGNFCVIEDEMSVYRKVRDLNKMNVCSQNLKDIEGSRYRQITQISMMIDIIGPSLTLYCLLADAVIVWVKNIKNVKGLLNKLLNVLTLRNFPFVFFVPWRLIVLKRRFIGIKKYN